MTDRQQIAGITGRTAVVTGAAGGIGGAVVAALTEAGARVVGWDTTGAPDPDTLDVDVTDAAAVRDAWRRTEDTGGPVDLLVSELRCAYGS